VCLVRRLDAGAKDTCVAPVFVLFVEWWKEKSDQFLFVLWNGESKKVSEL
jgi:hypothetical protein